MMEFVPSAPPAMIPAHGRRAERARRARDTTLRVIPDLLRLHPRARHGIHRAEQFVDPDALPSSTSLPRTDLQIRIRCCDTLSAAAALSEKPYHTRRASLSTTARPLKSRPPPAPNTAILNMASATRPGGGFLDGANNQEEFLCARSTLYPSLWEGHYRLPDLSAVHSPDILVFRDSFSEAHDLPQRDWYYVDVISAAMFRFSASDAGCSCGISYCDRHRDLVLGTMRAVLRVAQRKHAQRLVLGAWGCGVSAGNHPVREIARCWRKVLAGSPRQRKPPAEQWEGIREIVFAIPDRTMLKEFEVAFADILAPDAPPSSGSSRTLLTPPDTDFMHVTAAETEVRGESDVVSATISRIAAMEMQIEQARNSRFKQTLRTELAALNRDLARGVAAQNLRDVSSSSSSEGEEEEEDERSSKKLVSGYGTSRSAENSFYNFDEDDVPSDDDEVEEDDDDYTSSSADCYEFRPDSGLPAAAAAVAAGKTTADGLNMLRPPSSHSPRFDPHGWFHGSVDELTRELNLGLPGLPPALGDVTASQLASPVGSPEASRGGSFGGFGRGG